MAELNAKQEAFCLEYVKDLNGTRAAIRAGYSENGAEVTASKLLRIPKVAERIGEMQTERADDCAITVNRILREYAKLAFTDPTKFFKVGEDGIPRLDMSGATADDLACVTSVHNELVWEGKGEDATPVRKVKVTFASRQAALDSLAKHLGMFIERQMVSMDLKGVIELGDDELLARASAIAVRQSCITGSDPEAS